MSRGSKRYQRAQRRRHLVVGARVLLALLVLLLGVAKSVSELEFWKPPKGLLLAGAVVIGLATLRDQVVLAWAQHRAPKREGLHKDATSAVFAALAEIGDHSGVGALELGGSVWLVRRDWVWWGPEYLHRLMRVRPRLGVPAADVDWVKGKGCIGLCWADDQARHKDLASVARRYYGQTISEGGFERIPARTRQNLTLIEFQSIVGRYAEVAAVPIRNEAGTIIGVLSVDLLLSARPAAAACVLGDGSTPKPQYVKIMDSAARLVSEKIESGLE